MDNYYRSTGDIEELKYRESVGWRFFLLYEDLVPLIKVLIFLISIGKNPIIYENDVPLRNHTL